MKAMFKEQRAINEQLMENNKLLVEEIKEIKQSYKESESKREQRDLALMEIVRSMQETKNQSLLQKKKRSGGSFGSNVISWGIMSGI
ncbi:hypothetical protein AAAC51_26990 [Priestia megaterium]